MSHNGVYITQIYGPRRPWENPVQQNLKTEGLPLWLLLHGFTDYHAKAGDVQQLMTDNHNSNSFRLHNPKQKKN